jgi:hypothetical protein
VFEGGDARPGKVEGWFFGSKSWQSGKAGFGGGQEAKKGEKARGLFVAFVTFVRSLPGRGHKSRAQVLRTLVYTNCVIECVSCVGERQARDQGYAGGCRMQN